MHRSHIIFFFSFRAKKENKSILRCTRHSIFVYRIEMLYSFVHWSIEANDKDRFSNIMIHDIELFPSTVRHLHCTISFSNYFHFAINNINLILFATIFHRLKCCLLWHFTILFMFSLLNEFSFIIVSLHFPNEYVKYILYTVQTYYKYKYICTHSQRHLNCPKHVNGMRHSHWIVCEIYVIRFLYTQLNSFATILFPFILLWNSTENIWHYFAWYCSYNKRAHVVHLVYSSISLTLSIYIFLVSFSTVCFVIALENCFFITFKVKRINAQSNAICLNGIVACHPIRYTYTHTQSNAMIMRFFVLIVSDIYRDSDC